MGIRASSGSYVGWYMIWTDLLKLYQVKHCLQVPVALNQDLCCRWCCCFVELHAVSPPYVLKRLLGSVFRDPKAPRSSIISYVAENSEVYPLQLFCVGHRCTKHSRIFACSTGLFSVMMTHFGIWRNSCEANFKYVIDQYHSWSGWKQ